MKKLVLIFIFATILVIGFFLSYNLLKNEELETRPDIKLEVTDGMGTIGYITAMDENNRALIVEPNSNKYGFYNATYVMIPTSIQGMEIGQKVKVIFLDGGMDDSYPGQTGFGEFRVLEPQITGTYLPEEEVLRIALEADDRYGLFKGIKEISFEESSTTWSIQMINALYPSNSSYFVRIDDATGEVIEISDVAE